MIAMYFGSPGCGKSTLLSKLAILAHRAGYDHVVTNAEDCTVAARIDLADLETKTLPPNTLLLIDEAGICYNNRKYKSFGSGVIEWYKMHRHEECDVILFSQSFDIDVTIRRLVNDLFYLKKIGPFTLIKRVYKTVDVDDQTHQIIDAYKFGKLLGNFTGAKNVGFIFRPLYYWYFDSYVKLDREVMDIDDSRYNLPKSVIVRTVILDKLGRISVYLLLFMLLVWFLSLLA